MPSIFINRRISDLCAFIWVDYNNQTLNSANKRHLFHVFCHIRLHSAIQAKQKDKQTISQLEKRLKAEQEARALAEKQLAEERKRKKIEEATAARAIALAAATRCTTY